LKSYIQEDFNVIHLLGTAIKFNSETTLNRLQIIADSINKALNLKDKDSCTVNKIMMRLDIGKKPAELLDEINKIKVSSNGRVSPSV